MYKLEVNGELHIVYKDDFPTLIKEYMGEDAYRIVRDLVNKINYNEHKLNSDLKSYENQVVNYEYWAKDVLEIADELLKYLNEAKRIDRKRLQYYIKRISALTSQIF